MVMGLSPRENYGRSYPFHENGKKLQNNMSESIRGFSIYPLYSHQSARRIDTIPKKEAKHQNIHKIESTYSERKQNYKKCIKITDTAKGKTIVILYPLRKKIIITNAFNQEVIQ